MTGFPFLKALEVKRYMRDYIKPAVILFIICVVVSSALSLTNSVTAGIIKERVEADAVETRRQVLADADSFEKIDLEEYLTKSNLEKLDFDAILEVYKGYSNGKFCGYAFTAETKGYGGKIKVIIGINEEGRTTGVRIIESNETPGLGSKASEEPFISQLIGILPKKPLSVVKGKKTSDDEIEAISGATITSKAMVKAVQAAIDVSAELRKAEAGGKGNEK